MKEDITMIPRGLLALLSGALAVAALAGTLHFGDIRVNASASLPIGLYRITADQSAELVEFCPAEPFGSLSANRAYRGKGNCPDGAEPLMKPIVAIAGDTVTVSPAGVAVNEVLLHNSAPLELDTNHRPLRHWPFGKYRVVTGTVWVISSYNARSFDSRYFGPVATADIRWRLKPLITE
jgi:conjugative transfer signal peptidase TraF